MIFSENFSVEIFLELKWASQLPSNSKDFSKNLFICIEHIKTRIKCGNCNQVR